MNEFQKELMKRLFLTETESSKKRWVEFYDSDWESLQQLKKKVGVEWKDFFRVIIVMYDEFQNNPEIDKEIKKMVEG